MCVTFGHSGSFNLGVRSYDEKISRISNLAKAFFFLNFVGHTATTTIPEKSTKTFHCCKLTPGNRIFIYRYIQTIPWGY